MSAGGYELVQLKNGTWSVRSVAEGETFHPVIGPVAEADALYVRQLRLAERFAAATGEFVLWDVGLGAAANVLTALRALAGGTGSLRVVSFDHTLEPLRFALGGAAQLGFVEGFEAPITELLARGSVHFELGAVKVHWETHLGDFPTLLASAAATTWPAPHAILFDAYSPARNAAMWTRPLFARLRELAGEACTLATYSRATILRTTLLLAGWFVGAGHATGEKEETTIASTRLDLLAEPLPAVWLERVRRSTSAEPLEQATYRQAPLSESNWERLNRHPQFATTR
jgi:tRNA U34 5-methylaminomethyl-2-thiouridine-forming methyltransferase MnmC